jgi:pimeloyl-ACP methyl ester carboxylesterase
MISQVAETQPHVEGVEHRYLDVAAGDGPLRVHLAEAGEGEPLLLIHGWPQHWYEWRKLVPLVSGRRRMLIPDLRGFGWTATPGRGYDPETFAADAVALLDALELDRSSSPATTGAATRRCWPEYTIPSASRAFWR